MNALSRRAGAVALGLALDRIIGEPPAPVHPVAWFGDSMTRLEMRIWADDRLRGVGYTATGVSAGLLAGRLLRFTTPAVMLTVAASQLRAIAMSVAELAGQADLGPARQEVASLVGRNVADLDSSAIAAAAIESVAENTVDATFSAAFWAMVGGASGACAYRAVNTMDAMVGHHNDRFERFGWSAARLDDLANWLPARLFALVVALVRPRAAEHVRHIVKRDSSTHPSPNAGVAEAAIAAATGRQLGGPLSYGTRSESRPTLGDGPRPIAGDIAKAVAIVDDVEKALVVALVTLWIVGLAMEHR